MDGVQVNYHVLSDFRSLNGDFLDKLLSVNLASQVGVFVVKLQAVAQDGVRVPAGAGAGSFRREQNPKATWRLRGNASRSLSDMWTMRLALIAGAGKRVRSVRPKKPEACVQAAPDRLSVLAEIKQRQGKKAEDAHASSTDANATVKKKGMTQSSPEAQIADTPHRRPTSP